MDNTNYFPKRDTGTIDVPEFLAPIDDFTEEVVNGINEAIDQAQRDNEANAFHLKELDKVADAYNEEEARIIVKRLVSNYPEIVLGEVAELIRDMQELSGAILKNSKIFASKRGEV